jgi:23S rRNA pseudouridine1911/1915/1917 synthase
VTRTRIQQWIRAGQVTINGRRAGRAAVRPHAGDHLSISFDGNAVSWKTHPEPQNVPVDVLYEDDHLLAVNKPAGVVTHPAYKHPTGTLLNALLWRARQWMPPRRPSVVGRLDKLTSGLVVVAKTAEVHAALQRELNSSRSTKDYLALVYGHVKPVRGRIDLPLGRDACDRRRVVVVPDGGTPCVTLFERLAHVPAPHVGLSLLRCRLSTGRMHQIRVHLAARRTPIVGDPVYGEAAWKHLTDVRLASRLAAFPRQALHAHRLEFTHPITGARLQIEAPVPEDLRGILEGVGILTIQGVKEMHGARAVSSV